MRSKRKTKKISENTETMAKTKVMRTWSQEATPTSAESILPLDVGYRRWLPEKLINLALIFEFELPVGLFGGNEIKGWVIIGERQDLITGAQVMETHKSSCGHRVRQWLTTAKRYAVPTILEFPLPFHMWEKWEQAKPKNLAPVYLHLRLCIRLPALVTARGKSSLT